MEKKPLNEGYQPMRQGNFGYQPSQNIEIGGYQPNGEIERRGYQPTASNLNATPTPPRGGSSVKPLSSNGNNK